MCIRAREIRSTGFFPYEALMGRPMRLWEDMVKPVLGHLATVALSEGLGTGLANVDFTSTNECNGSRWGGNTTD